MQFITPSAKEDGFTIVEILVVLIVLAILAAVAVPLYIEQRKAAYEAVLKSDLVHVGEQVNAEHDFDTGGFPEPFPVHSTEDPLPSGGPYTPVVLSDGVHINYEGNPNGFCVTGLHTGNSSNVWGYSSALGGLTRDVAACLSGTTVTDEDAGSDTDPITDPSDSDVTGDLETDPPLPGKCFPELIGVTRYLNEYMDYRTPESMMLYIAWRDIYGYGNSTLEDYYDHPDTVHKFNLNDTKLNPMQQYIFNDPVISEEYYARNREMTNRYDAWREDEMTEWYYSIIAEEIRNGQNPYGTPNQKIRDAYDAYTHYFYQWNYIQCNEYAYPGHENYSNDAGYTDADVQTWPLN